ncbi:protein STPG3 [Sorex araneus]|uniref:protein STPG3 n=1 Tax=Sorex araneus TaxID=42254 RepID=UPI000331751D|nr:protein STPG3 [Sorex araneus]
MNFDQKAVKFLANFYINGGRHWTHGPLRPTPLLLPQPVHRTVVLLNLKHQPREEAWFQQSAGPMQQMVSWPVTTQVLQKQLLGQRPPILIDPDVPGPTTYKVPDASIREPSSHPHFSIGHRPPTHERRGSRVWQGQWLQSESPFLQSTALLKEPKESPWSPAFVNHSTPFASGGRSCSWSSLSAACTPGPATYRTEDHDKMPFPSAPGVVIQGVQRPKPQDKNVSCTT